VKDKPVTHDFMWPLAHTNDLKNIVIDMFYSKSLVAEKRIEKSKSNSKYR
jgi:hypothetical protein